MQSKATSVEEYVASLPEDRRFAIAAIREVILKNLQKDFEEGMQYGMIGYYVPHRVYPAGYHCDPKQPLPFVALASQKNYISLYMMSLYNDGQRLKSFLEAWKKTGKKLDMGKSCVRFKRLEDLALDVVADAIRSTTAKEVIDQYARMSQAASQGSNPATKKAASKKGNAKKVTSKKVTSKKVVSKKVVSKKVVSKKVGGKKVTSKKSKSAGKR